MYHTNEIVIEFKWNSQLGHHQFDELCQIDEFIDFQFQFIWQKEQNSLIY